MRVLLISHTCQSIREGQPKAACLAAYSDICLRVLVPDRWKDYWRWRTAETPACAEYDFDIQRVRFPWNPVTGWHLHHYPGLARTLSEFKPDIVDIWEEPYGFVSAHSVRLCKTVSPNARIIAETEQNICKRLPPPFERFRKYTLSNASFVVARNLDAVDAVRAKGYRGPAAVVPNAVDAELFRPMDRARCRAKLGVDGFVAGYVGRLVEEKGLAEIVDALPNCPAVTVVIVGSGPYKDELIRRARTAGVGSHIRFLPARPIEELPEIMNAFDTLLLPSRTTKRWKEQFGRVLIEAQACEVPVIGSSSGAIPDVVGEAGLVVSERNPTALAAAIIELQRNPSRARQMGKIGRRRVEAHYTWAQVAARMYEIYTEVSETGRRPSAAAEA